MSTHPEIPAGSYCYTPEGYDPQTGKLNIKICPHWSKDLTRPHQANGYCNLLQLGDWMPPGNTLLWDQCKECGVNLE